MKEQMGSVSREVEILRGSQTEMPGIRSTVTGARPASDGLISGLDTAEERLAGLGK